MTQKSLICCFLVFLISSCNIPRSEQRSHIEKVLTELNDPSSDYVLVAAHRGDWRNFPENSLAAIESAIEMGVDIVELDVQMTADSVLILMHDRTVDRTTTGKGSVSEWTIDSLRTLRLRNGCAIRTIHKVPTLEEALVAGTGRIMFNLDKADRYFDKVYKLAEKTGTTGQIIMKGSASPDKVREHFGHWLDDIIYMPIVNLDLSDAQQDVVRFMEQLEPVAFELLFESDDNPLPRRMPEVLDGRALIWYNTLWYTMAGGHDDDASLTDPNAGYGYLIDSLGCRIIQTDRPQMLLDYLRSRKLHD